MFAPFVAHRVHVLTLLPSGFRHYQGRLRWSRSSKMLLPVLVCDHPLFVCTTSITLRCSVGRPKHVRVMAGALEGDVFIGRRAQEFRGLLKIKYPMEHGIVTDWDDMERIWSWIYAEELGTLSEEVRLRWYSSRHTFPNACLTASRAFDRSPVESSQQSRRCCSNLL